MRKSLFLLAVLLLSAVLFVSSKEITAQPLPTPPPSLKFPWDAGQSKKWTLGPHGSIPGNYGTVVNNPWSQVYALDFGGSFDVLAMQAGRVIYVNNSQVKGCGDNGIQLDHGGFWLTEYCHLSARYAPNGAWIAQGSLLGKTGNAGCPGCPIHLHVSVLYSQNGTFNRVYWDDKVIDGWRIHNVYNPSGQPLYGFGSATREGKGWGWKYGNFNNGGVTGPAKFLAGVPNDTRTSSIILSYGTKPNDVTYSNHWFVSSNKRP